MWKIETSGGLGQKWLTPNSWEEGEGEEEEELFTKPITSLAVTNIIANSFML